MNAARDAVATAEATYEHNRVRLIYEGSDGDATRALYDELAAKGPLGIIAVNLFRAQKCSARAKIYRTGHYSTLAYGRKNWSLDQLAAVLNAADAPCFRWGWGTDSLTIKFPWVLYVDLPQGQVSFHAAVKGEGPMYPGAWDGVEDASTDRILAFVDAILHPNILMSGGPTLAVDAGRVAIVDNIKESQHDQKGSPRRRRPRRRLSRPKRRR